MLFLPTICFCHAAKPCESHRTSLPEVSFCLFSVFGVTLRFLPTIVLLFWSETVVKDVTSPMRQMPTPTEERLVHGCMEKKGKRGTLRRAARRVKVSEALHVDVPMQASVVARKEPQ